MEHKENEMPEEKLLRQEKFKVDCPRRIVVGDPSYFEEFTGERLKRLTASYTPPHFYEARVLLTEVEFSDFPGGKGMRPVCLHGSEGNHRDLCEL